MFNKERIMLVNETYEYLYESSGWVITLLSVIVVHLYGKYIIINLVIALMKKDF